MLRLLPHSVVTATLDAGLIGPPSLSWPLRDDVRLFYPG